MSSAACRKPAISINRNVGNVTDRCRDVWNCEISAPDEKRQILEWLSPLAPRARHQAIGEGRINRLGDWLLRTNEFEKWHTGEDQAVHPVLFCYGDPGVGKTYLRCVKVTLEMACKTKPINTSSLVIDTLSDSTNGGNVAVACMYCDFLVHKEQSAAGVLAALLKQLVAEIEPMPQEITEAFERAKREVDGWTLRLPEICAMLVKSLSSPRRVFICIDALDEFPTKHRPELWNSLRGILRECPNTRLFISGRPHIREEVKKYFPECHYLMPIKPPKEDIQGYILMRLERDSEPDAMDMELGFEILRIISDKISGVYVTSVGSESKVIG